MSHEQFLAIEDELNTRLIDRSKEVRGLILAMLSGKHVEILGPPGNAKTMLITEVCGFIQASYFGWLLTSDTSADELFGPVDIQALKQGEYKRITNHKMPEAEVVYLDEIYKANSRVLNACLGILQERKFNNNGTEMDCPLIFCVGSSNELPDEESHLQAFRDRFLLRYNPGYFTEPTHFEAMLDLRGAKKNTVAPIEKAVLLQAQSEVLSMPLGGEAKDSLMLVWEKLLSEGFQISPRRYQQMVDVMAADSWLVGATEIQADSVIVGENILWTKIDEVRTVQQIIRSSINPNLARATDILAGAKQAYADLDDYSTHPQIMQVLQQIRQMMGDVQEINTNERVAVIASELNSMAEETLKRMLSKLDTQEAV